MQTTQITFEISRRILAKVAEGMQIDAAFDAVIGEGAYKRMAIELHAAMTVSKDLAA